MPAGYVPFPRRGTYSIIEANSMSASNSLKMQYKLRSVLILHFPHQPHLLRIWGIPRKKRICWPLILPDEAILLYLN
jgi:hypothetical protein